MRLSCIFFVIFANLFQLYNFSTILEKPSNPAKILFLLPVASKSHKNVFDPLVNALLDRGHSITVVSPVKTARNHPNLREIHPVTLDEILKSPVMSGGNMFQNRKKGKLRVLLDFNNSFVEEVCHRFYENKEIQQIIETREQFDLAFVNAIPNQCTLGLVHVLQIPHVYLGTLPLTNSHVGSVGGYFPRSFIPSPFGPYIDNMNFPQRVMNFIIEMLSSHFYYHKGSTLIYRKHLGDHVPTVEEIDKNVSMIFMNTNFLLTFPRPLLPAIVEVGGMHCRTGRPETLPLELKELLDNAQHGFIYFSMGSIVRTKSMPEDIRRKFLNVFSRLQYLVIWKWDNENETDLPANVVVKKWLPQQDILAHPNIKLFITHGGLLSTQESVFHGVPILGAPLYVDQDLNMNQAENLGVGLRLEITDFTEQVLEDKIQRILTDSRFSEKAKQISRIFKDQQETPIERAVFWTEYVIRHKGASHLRSAAIQLNQYQYHSIDVILFLGGILLAFLMVIRLLFKKLVQIITNFLACCCKKKSKIN